MSLHPLNVTLSILEIIQSQVTQADMLIKSSRIDLTSLKPNFQYQGIIPYKRANETIKALNQVLSKLNVIKAEISSLSLMMNIIQEKQE